MVERKSAPPLYGYGRYGSSSSNTKVKAPVVPKPAPKKADSSGKAASHPPAYVMVLEAVAALAERGGSSLQAIKSYIADYYQYYNVNIKKLAPFIRKAVIKQVEEGKLTRTTGTGANGSFKITTKPKAAKKPAAEKKAKTVVAKAKSPKKAAAAASPKKAKKVVVSASPKTAKKSATPKKAPAKKAPASPKKAPVKPKPAVKKGKKAVKPKSPKKSKTSAKPKLQSN